jgi:hypothetical protein
MVMYVVLHALLLCLLSLALAEEQGHSLKSSLGNKLRQQDIPSSLKYINEDEMDALVDAGGDFAVLFTDDTCETVGVWYILSKLQTRLTPSRPTDPFSLCEKFAVAGVELANDLPHVTFVRVNLDLYPNLLHKYITTIPGFLLFKGGVNKGLVQRTMYLHLHDLVFMVFR